MKPMAYLMGLTAVLTVLVVSSCSTAKVRVLAGEDGVNRVVVRDIERDGSEDAAYHAAENYCKDEKKHTVYVKEEATQYTGSIDESTRKTVRGFSKVAMLLSPVAGAATRDRTLGGVLGGAGLAGYGMTSDRDYKSELRFKCI